MLWISLLLEGELHTGIECVVGKVEALQFKRWIFNSWLLSSPVGELGQITLSL